VARGRTRSLIPPSCVDLRRAPECRRSPSGARSPEPVDAGLPSQTWQDSSGVASRSGHGTDPRLTWLRCRSRRHLQEPSTDATLPPHRLRGLSQIRRPWTPGLSCRARRHDDASSRVEPPGLTAAEGPRSFGLALQPTSITFVRVRDTSRGITSVTRRERWPPVSKRGRRVGVFGRFHRTSRVQGPWSG
jgi:hypothetical protein